MSNTFKITNGPSEMDVMISLFRRDEVTFFLDTDQSPKRRTMRIRAVSNGMHSTATAAYIAQYGGCESAALLLEAIGGMASQSERGVFYMAYEPWSRRGILQEVAVRGKRVKALEDPLRVCWGDLIHGSADWQKYIP